MAWLNVKTKAPCNDDMSVPLVSGAGRQGKRYYIYHKQRLGTLKVAALAGPYLATAGSSRRI